MKMAILFPGQGSQYVGMGGESLSNEVFYSFVKRADQILGFELSRIMLSGPEDILTLTENAQPAIFMVSYALFSILRNRLHNAYDLIGAGHSLGEYTAISCAGGFSFEDCLRIVRMRGKFMQEAVPPSEGAMIAVMADVEKIKPQIERFSNIWISSINAENQVVISGRKEEIDKFYLDLKEKNIRATYLKVSAPFHCPLMQPAYDKLKKFMENIETKDLNFQVLSAHTLEYYTKDKIKETLLDGIVSSVNFLGCIKKLNQDGVEQFVEIGPGRVLSSLVKRIIPTAKIYTINSIADIETFLKSIGHT